MPENWKSIGKWGLVVLVGLLIIGGCQYLLNGGNGRYTEATVQKRNLSTKVTVAGTVVPAEKAELAFEVSGRVREIHVEIGEEISTGDPIITLENQDTKADVAEAEARLASQKAQLQQFQASLKTEQARLSELKTGTRQEELDIAETDKGNAAQALTDRVQILDEQHQISVSKLEKDLKTLEDAQENYDSIIEQNETDTANLYDDIPLLGQDAINSATLAAITKTSDIFTSTNPNASISQLSEGADYVATFSIPDGQVILEGIASTKKKATLRYKADLEKGLEALDNESTAEEQEQILSTSQKVLKTALEFLQYTKDLLNVADDSSEISAINSYRTANNEATIDVTNTLNNIEDQLQLLRSQKIENQNRLIAAREKLNAAKNSYEITKITTQQEISSAQSDVNAAQNNLKSAAKELDLKLAGTREEQIEAQEALVAERRASLGVQQAKLEESEAEVLRKKAILEKTILRSPINGIVSRQDSERGEIIAANDIIAAVLSEENFEIEANIPEINIASVKRGQTAKVTLDAYGDDIIFEASIIHIDPAETLVDNVPNYEVTLQFAEKDERILSGMTANITLTTAVQENVLSVPQRAVFSEEGKRYVLKKNENQDSEKTSIESSFLSTDGFRSISSGLSEGDIVLIPYE